MSVARDAALALAALAFAGAAHGTRDFVDDAGRKVSLPDRVERVYAAGPPASVLVFAIAPDTLIGWTRAFRDDEAQWVPERYARLPELGRLTGRGNTAKRAYLSPHLPFGWFDYPPGANRLVGLLWLSEILYPQVFRHDLKREVTEFYRLFYHQAPSAEQIERLLGEPGVATR